MCEIVRIILKMLIQEVEDYGILIKESWKAVGRDYLGENLGYSYQRLLVVVSFLKYLLVYYWICMLDIVLKNLMFVF